MSRIQEALKRLQRAETQAPRRRHRNEFKVGDQLSSVPIARKKKYELTGPKHAVSQQELVAAGILAPLDHALPVAGEFRRIKRPLIANIATELSGLSQHLNVIMVASPLPKAGKTFCTVNLAVSMSLERDLNVVLVDADVAKPHVTHAFGFEKKPGLIDLLSDESLSIDELLIRTDLNDIQVLPAGSGHQQATELLASERMAEVLEELASRYSDRIILVDSPPMLITSEAQALADQVGQIALVVEAGETSHQELIKTIESLDGDKPLNVILNKTRHALRGGQYGSDYGYYGYE